MDTAMMDDGATNNCTTLVDCHAKRSNYFFFGAGFFLSLSLGSSTHMAASSSSRTVIFAPLPPRKSSAFPLPAAGFLLPPNKFMLTVAVRGAKATGANADVTSHR
jgi:hypothetical protein